PSPPSPFPLAGDEGVIALIKPQFEAGRKETARNKGVIRDPEVHKAVLEDVLAFAQGQGFSVRGLIRSPLLGPKGNVEFLAWLGMEDAGQTELPVLVQRVLGE
ncbi:MAG: TlyA family rRNA (cytidine-2'-O)-methyltransferase, partial [Chloroflexi bacterium]|nr:TlyA family rRNA (cytidine-2'-O)-methyltransferase [Chloroflexota bacterium]